MRIFIIAIMTLIFGALPAYAAKPPIVYAVIVGSNAGDRENKPLSFADDDALRFYRMLRNTVPENHIIFLSQIDDKTASEGRWFGTESHVPTGDKILAALSATANMVKAARDASPGTKVSFFYYHSGHGISDGLLLPKSESQPLVGEALDASKLYDALTAVPADYLNVFIDACYAASMFYKGAGRSVAMSSGPDFSPAIEVYVNDLVTREPRLGVLTVSNSTIEDPGIRSGLFSHLLVSGLAGAADVDANRRVDYGELMAFVEYYLGDKAMTYLHPPGGDPNTNVIDFSLATTGIDLVADMHGQFTLLDSDQKSFIAEFNKEQGEVLRLVLASGVYYLVHNTPPDIGRGGLISVPQNSFVEFREGMFQDMFRYANRKGPAQSFLLNFDQYNPLSGPFRRPFSSDIVRIVERFYRTVPSDHSSPRMITSGSWYGEGELAPFVLGGVEMIPIVTEGVMPLIDVRGMYQLKSGLIAGALFEIGRANVDDEDRGGEITVVREGILVGFGTPPEEEVNVAVAAELSAFSIWHQAETGESTGDMLAFNTGLHLLAHYQYKSNFLVGADIFGRLHSITKPDGGDVIVGRPGGLLTLGYNW
jgi:hypothetical protein